MPIRLRDQSVYLGRAAASLDNFAPNFDGSFVGVGTFTGVLARQLQPFTGALVGQYQAVSLKTGTIGVTLQNVSSAIVGATADTVAPPAPSAPTIDAFTSTSITIRFPTSAASDHASWNVWRSPEGNFWTQIATGITAATYTNSGLTASTVYYYALVDVDDSSNASPLGASVSQETSAAGSGVGHGYAVTHYASASASGGGDGSLGNPWTAAEAFASATAGNIVEFAPGVYPAPDTNMGFFLGNSGTSSSPIVLVSKYPAVHNQSNSSLWSQITAANRHCISNDRTGTSNKEYIVIDGFRTYQNTGNDFDGSGHHIFLHNDTGGTNNWKLRRILFDQENLADTGTVAANGGDNYGAIWTQGCSNIEITDCKFTRFVGTSHNQTVWTTYSIEGCVFKNCETDDVASGPYIKGNASSPDNRPIQIHHNILKNCRGVQIEPNIIGNVAGSAYCDIFQNYFVAESGYNLGVRSSGSPSSDYPQYTRVVNNTFVGKAGSELLGQNDAVGSIWLWGSLTSATAQGTECYFRNNIVQSSATPNGVHRGSSAGDDTGAARPNSDYNLYSSNFENQFGSAGNQSKATWTAASTREGNSAFGTATFADSGNDDYTLSGGSDGEDLGVDILNLLGGGTSAAINAGADIGDGDTIGIRSASVINAESFNWTYPFA